MTIETKKYRFTIEIEATPYRPDTAKHIFGEDAAYISDYPENIVAHELAFEFAKSAVLFAIEAKINFLANDRHNRYAIHRANETIEQFKKIEKSMQPMTDTHSLEKQ